MGTDGAWRWRKGVEDKYHYRFWGQVVRWMAYQRNMAKGETMRLYYVPDQPKMNQTLALHANVMEQSGEPLHGGEVVGADHGPLGQGRARSGSPRRATSGASSPAGSRAEEPGKHQVVLSCKQTGRRSRRRSSSRAWPPSGSASRRGRRFWRSSPA